VIIRSLGRRSARGPGRPGPGSSRPPIGSGTAKGKTARERIPTLDATDGPLRALLLENIHPDAASRLAKDGHQVETVARGLAEDELIDAVGGVHLLGIRSGTHITERVLDAAPSLLAIGAFCIGVNQVDLAAASRRGIAVFNAPFSNTRSVVSIQDRIFEPPPRSRGPASRHHQSHGEGGRAGCSERNLESRPDRRLRKLKGNDRQGSQFDPRRLGK
jgi:hypothetical protein